MNELETKNFIKKYEKFKNNNMPTPFYDENNKLNSKIVNGHLHGHLFEEVVLSLYNCPESFKISKDEEKYYSTQELEYLKLLQKYLLFICMKDILYLEKNATRYQNELQKKYENIRIKKFDNDFIDKILNNEINYQTIDIPNNYNNLNITGHRFLIIDEEFEFRLLIEYEKEQIVNNKLLLYFKVLENYS